jgi:hypothetical protein
MQGLVVIDDYQSLNPEVLLKQYKDSNEFIYSYVSKAYNDVYHTLEEGGKMPSDCEYYYYINNGKTTYTNVKNTNKAFFSQFDNAYYAYEKGKWTFGVNTNTNSLSMQNFNKNHTVYIAFSDDFIKKHQRMGGRTRYLNTVCIIYNICLYIIINIFYLVNLHSRQKT